MTRKRTTSGQSARCSRGVEVAAGDVRRLAAEVAVEDALDHPEHVGGAEDDAGGGERRSRGCGAR